MSERGSADVHAEGIVEAISLHAVRGRLLSRRLARCPYCNEPAEWVHYKRIGDGFYSYQCTACEEGLGVTDVVLPTGAVVHTAIHKEAVAQRLLRDSSLSFVAVWSREPGGRCQWLVRSRGDFDVRHVWSVKCATADTVEFQWGPRLRKFDYPDYRERAPGNDG
jgi:hypothetical protein